jgi:hypothetical protein
VAASVMGVDHIGGVELDAGPNRPTAERGQLAMVAVPAWDVHGAA